MIPGFLIQEIERMELTLAELEKTKGCVGLGSLWKSMIVWLWMLSLTYLLNIEVETSSRGVGSSGVDSGVKFWLVNL